MSAEGATGIARSAHGRARRARAGGWVALAEAVGAALAIFLLPYAAMDELTRRDWWSIAFQIAQGDPVIYEPRRLWSHGLWAWVGLVSGMVGALLMVVGGGMALRAAPDSHRGRPTGSGTAVALAVSGAGAFAASTLLAAGLAARGGPPLPRRGSLSP